MINRQLVIPPSAIFLVAVLSLLSTTAGGRAATVTSSDIGALKKLSFEELFNLEITTVSRRPERLVDAASAIQVITGEEIRRSGALNLPDALRLATNLQVAQINAYNWAITARGFNAVTANKLLVLIDGRTVYTPLFSGVFWDVQNVMLDDIDRIEVISGPGATLWGANAVNGVVNVITKNARDSQGALLSGGAGSFIKGFGSGRYGGKLGDDLHYRVYGMGFGRDNTFLASGRAATDDWKLGQGGFRADFVPGKFGSLSVQGNFYGGSEELTARPDLTLDGQNLLARWSRPLQNDSELSVQVYWDRTHRRNPGIFLEATMTISAALNRSQARLDNS